MKRTGPLLTLAAGVVVAAVLMVLNLRATNAATEPAAAGGPDATATTTAAAPTVAPTTEAPAVPPATYAGPVSGGAATIAIAVKDGQAVAYVCDGARAEAWLQGPARGGKLTLTGENASLTATYANGVVAGTVTAAGRDFSFSVGQVQEPSGLYRASATVNNATVVGGWIVLADGTQVGTQRSGNTVSPAPPLNVANRTSVLGGSPVTVTAIDGTKL